MAEHGSIVAARRLVRLLEVEQAKHVEKHGSERGFPRQTATSMGVDAGYVGRLMDRTRTMIGLKAIEGAMKTFKISAAYFLDHPGGPDPDPDTFRARPPARERRELENALAAKSVEGPHREALHAIPYELFEPATREDLYALINAIEYLTPLNGDRVQDGPAAVRVRRMRGK
jgi:hypothetical protein